MLSIFDNSHLCLIIYIEYVHISMNSIFKLLMGKMRYILGENVYGRNDAICVYQVVLKQKLTFVKKSKCGDGSASSYLMKRNIHIFRVKFFNASRTFLGG